MENGSNLSQSMDSVNTVEKYAGEEEVSYANMKSIVYDYDNIYENNRISRKLQYRKLKHSIIII